MTLQHYTRADLVARVLAHGSMTRVDLRECMGWPGRAADGALHSLMQQREVRGEHAARGAKRYRLTNTARVRAFAEGS